MALITGGGSGLESGIALALASRGIAAAVLGRTLTQCEETAHDVQERGGAAIALGCDLSSAEEMTGAVTAVLDRWGRIGILVHCAQSVNYAALHKLTPQDVDESWCTGPRGAMSLMQSAYQPLRQTRGLIVNIASGVGIAAPAGMAAYAMAKEAVCTLRWTTAAEWGPHGIRAVSLCPFAATPGLEFFETKFGLSCHSDLISEIPLRRLGIRRRTWGAVVAFLASEEGSYITGTTLMVDGGYTDLR
ncbi:SDR family NAD(P)-dependent oxidoreductase [Mycobacterium sp. MUNTM1]